jgi:hypothetical protein
VTTIADWSREQRVINQPQLASGQQHAVPGAQESTIEERLLDEVLAANEELLEALRMYDDLHRLGVEREVEKRREADAHMDRSVFKPSHTPSSVPGDIPGAADMCYDAATSMRPSAEIPEEDMRRLFQECKVGRGYASLLSQALAFAKPADLRRKEVIGVRPRSGARHVRAKRARRSSSRSATRRRSSLRHRYPGRPRARTGAASSARSSSRCSPPSSSARSRVRRSRRSRRSSSASSWPRTRSSSRRSVCTTTSAGSGSSARSRSAARRTRAWTAQ